MLHPEAILAFVTALVLTEAIRRQARARGLVSHPCDRSSHVSPTPRGGGIAIVGGILVAGLWAFPALPGPALAALVLVPLTVAALGLWEDLCRLSPGLRLVVQGLCCLVLVVVGPAAARLATLDPVPAALLTSLVLLGSVWWINLFNFMDGLDGLAAAQAIFMLAAAAGLAGTVATPLALVAAAATAGFLVHNRPPARIFMGDTGSTFLGAFILGLAHLTVASGSLPVPAWLLLGAVFLGDATVTLLVRFLAGARVTQAHRTHAYQHLAAGWASHGRVVFLVVAVDVALLLPAAAVVLRHPGWAWPLAVLVLTAVGATALALGAGLPRVIDCEGGQGAGSPPRSGRGSA